MTQVRREALRSQIGYYFDIAHMSERGSSCLCCHAPLVVWVRERMDARNIRDAVTECERCGTVLGFNDLDYLHNGAVMGRLCSVSPPAAPSPPPAERPRAPVVYIAHPYSADPDANADAACAVWDRLLRAGFTPVNPLWSHFQHVRHPVSYEEWIRYDLALLDRLRPDAVLRVPGASAGADREEAWADGHGVPVFTMVEQVVAYFGDAAGGRSAAAVAHGRAGG